MSYIKKEPIIEFITNGLNNPDKTKAFGHDAVEILAEIEYAPTADVVEVVHSKWIECHINESNEKYCDSCGCGFNLYYHNRADFRFCPYCGAMMHNDWIKHDNNEEIKERFYRRYNMISIDELKRCRHIRISGNKYFSWSWKVENGRSELISIRLFGKRFSIPRKLRKFTRHKEKI